MLSNRMTDQEKEHSPHGEEEEEIAKALRTRPYSIMRDPEGYAILRDGRIVISHIDDIADAQEVANQLNLEEEIT